MSFLASIDTEWSRVPTWISPISTICLVQITKAIKESTWWWCFGGGRPTWTPYCSFWLIRSIWSDQYILKYRKILRGVSRIITMIRCFFFLFFFLLLNATTPYVYVSSFLYCMCQKILSCIFVYSFELRVEYCRYVYMFCHNKKYLFTKINEKIERRTKRV